MNEWRVKWSGCLMVIGLVASGWTTIPDGLFDASWWDRALLIVWAGLVVGFLNWVVTVRKNPPIDPDTIPAADVEKVVAAFGGTVAAIRSLREMHPGLGLKDAKDLVEQHH